MGLKLRVEKPFVRDNTNRIVANESELVQQANLIASKVSQTDFNGNTISSLINQTATTIKIQAQKIQLEGLVTANNNFKVLLDGSIEAVNGKFSGNINGGTINIGSRFSVDASGNLVASNANLSGSITATKMTSSSSTNYYSEIGVTGGLVGLGLFDLRYGTEAFFEVLELGSGIGFTLRDKNNVSRFSASSGYTAIIDSDGKIPFESASGLRTIYSQNNAVRLRISDSGVEIIKNGVSLARWGF